MARNDDVTIKPGQRWRERDPRMLGRILTVLRTDGDRAECCAGGGTHPRVAFKSHTKLAFKTLRQRFDLLPDEGQEDDNA